MNIDKRYEEILKESITCQENEFEDFVMRRCKEIDINADTLGEKQYSELTKIYELGFIDAINILAKEKIIKIHSYI